MSDEPKEIKNLNQDDLNVEGLTPEELEQVSGGEDADLACNGFSCGTFSEN